MSVWKDSEGRWHAAVQRGGKRVHRICPKKAAWRDAKDLEAKIRRGFDTAAAGNFPIGEVIQKWLTEEVAHQKARKNTEGHAFALAEWVAGRNITEIADVAKEYKEAQRAHLTGSTINRRLAVLRRVANLAYKRWNMLSEPLGAKIEMMRENAARDVFLSRSELAQLLRAIPHREGRRMALVAAFSGLRRGELAALRPVHIQGDLIYVRQSKSGKSRVVPIVDHIRFAVKRLPFGLHRDNVTHMIAAAMPGVRFHDLRHTCASLLLAKGKTLEEVGQILGHTSAQTTKRYSHLSVNHLRNTMAALGTAAQRMHREKSTGARKVA